MSLSYNQTKFLFNIFIKIPEVELAAIASSRWLLQQS